MFTTDPLLLCGLGICSEEEHEPSPIEQGHDFLNGITLGVSQ